MKRARIQKTTAPSVLGCAAAAGKTFAVLIG